MKLSRIFGVIAIVVLASVFAVAADLNGSWTVKVESPRGTQEQTYTFKVDGKTLTGKLTTQRGDVELKNGKVDGDNIAFSVKLEFNGNSMVRNYSGVVAGDEIKMKSQTQRGAQEFVAKRAK